MNSYDQPQPVMCRRLPLIFAFVAATTLAGAGCRQDPPPETNEDTTATPVPVRVATVQSTTLHPSIDLVGTLVAIPEHTASICSLIAGRIRQLKVVEGDTVRAGDELLCFDSRLANAELAKAAASVDEKKAVLARLKRGFRPQEIEMTRQETQRSKATAEALRSKLEALTALRDRKEVSAVQYKGMQSSLQAAEAAYATARAKLELYEAGTRPEEIDEAEAKLAVAEADWAAAKLAVDFCTITSPIDGTVTRLFARRGMFVQPSTALATVVNLSNLFAQMRVPTTYLGKIKTGARVDVRVTSLSDKLFSGIITRISGQADPNTGDVDTFASIANEGGLLRPDLACRARVWLPDVSDTLVVPVAAIADRGGTPVVTVVRQNKAYETEVTLGVQTSDNIQVTHGLSSGDVVVTKGGYGLPQGCPVRILPGTPASNTEVPSR